MKTFLKLAAIALLALALLVVALALSLDRLVAEAIRRGATHATGVETTLDSADVSLRGGSLELSELRVANPQGFTDELFLGLGVTRLALETGSLFDPTIEVGEISLARIEANLERKDGRTNYDVILDHLARLGGPEEPAPEAEPAEPAGPQRSLHVRLIRLTDVQARVRLDLAGKSQSMSITIPEVRIEDFQSDGDTTQIVAQLTRAVIQAVLGAVVEFGGDLPTEFLKGLGGSLEGLTDDLQGRVEDVLEKVGGATEGIVPPELGEKANKAIDDAKKKLDGLLGGKKK